MNCSRVKNRKKVNEFQFLFVILFILICGSLFFSIYGIYLQNEENKCEPKTEVIKEKCVEKISYNAVLIHFANHQAMDVSFDYDVIEKIDNSSKNLDLHINGNYLLKFINGESIMFDTFGSYALYKGEIVKLDDQTWSLLEKLVSNKSSECCSCCPDLKPGESCIAMCCPCES